MKRRFGLYRIVEHQLFALVFISLVVTGLAQKFHMSGWAQWIVLNAGGIDVVRVIHRYAGLACAALVAQHMIVASWCVMVRRWAPTMLIDRRDFRNAIENIRYYFGMSNSPARCGRYDYKQKFEYWGVLLGSALMVATGLILWFPDVAFRLFPFLPGQIIPAAKVAHSNEAMLALLVIVTWHIYNAVFSPEVFPLDTSIFTGKISRERMEHEHPLERNEKDRRE